MKKDTYIIGVDYSLTSPAVSVLPLAKKGKLTFKDTTSWFYTKTGSLAGHWNGNVTGVAQRAWTCYPERYAQIANWVIAILEALPSVEYNDQIQVYLEDYALQGKGRVFEIAENTGLLKYMLWQRSIPVVQVPPTTLKKWYTGKGNAKKEQMYERFFETTGVDLKKTFSWKRAKIESPISDIVDSYALSLYGAECILKVP